MTFTFFLPPVKEIGQNRLDQTGLVLLGQSNRIGLLVFLLPELFDWSILDCPCKKRRNLFGPKFLNIYFIWDGNEKPFSSWDRSTPFSVSLRGIYTDGQPPVSEVVTNLISSPGVAVLTLVVCLLQEGRNRVIDRWGDRICSSIVLFTMGLYLFCFFFLKSNLMLKLIESNELLYLRLINITIYHFVKNQTDFS